MVVPLTVPTAAVTMLVPARSVVPTAPLRLTVAGSLDCQTADLVTSAID